MATYPSARSSAGLSLLLLLLSWPSLAESRWQLDGYLSLQGISAESPDSWLEGGFGRLWAGQGGGEQSDSALRARGHLAVDWQPGDHFGAYVHLLARSEPGEIRDRTGVVEAYLYSHFRPRRDDRLRIRLGTFFLPSTLEAVERPWTSPYTLSLSTFNAWIGEEVRPTGLMAEYDLGLANGDQLRLAGSVFGGNDTAGALLAWRGWAPGSRLSVFGELLPLPPLSSLAPGGGLADQRDEGTRPIGRDLDGRPGWAAVLGWQREGRGRISYTHYDNRGDRNLHRGEYAWHTSYDLFGAGWHLGRWLLLSGEAMQGYTAMGFPPLPRVAADFDAYYLLASWHWKHWRVGLRHESFAVDERDFSAAENNDEDGNAWTLTLLWEPREDLRLGLELVDLDSRRPELAAAGLDVDSDARALSLELRYYFGH